MNAIRWRILEIILEATYRGIAWRSGGKDSPLALQGAWGQSLVGPRTQIPQAAQCGAQKKKKKGSYLAFWICVRMKQHGGKQSREGERGRVSL